MILDFLKLRESVESLGKQLVSVRAQIEETKQQIETIVYAPSHPDDIVQAAQKWLEKKQANFESYFEQRIFRQFTSKPGRFEDDKRFSNDLHYTSLIADGKEDYMFVGLIGTDRIMEIFRERAAKIQPGEHGLRNAERGPALAALQKKLAKLVEEEKKLVDGAASAGLSV